MVGLEGHRHLTWDREPLGAKLGLPALEFQHQPVDSSPDTVIHRLAWLESSGLSDVCGLARVCGKRAAKQRGHAFWFFSLSKVNCTSAFVSASDFVKP